MCTLINYRLKWFTQKKGWLLRLDFCCSNEFICYANKHLALPTLAPLKFTNQTFFSTCSSYRFPKFRSWAFIEQLPRSCWSGSINIFVFEHQKAASARIKLIIVCNHFGELMGMERMTMTIIDRLK